MVDNTEGHMARWVPVPMIRHPLSETLPQQAFPLTCSETYPIRGQPLSPSETYQSGYLPLEDFAEFTPRSQSSHQKATAIRPTRLMSEPLWAARPPNSTSRFPNGMKSELRFSVFGTPP